MTTATSVTSIDVGQFDAAIFDLDGVVTKTARVHATAWKKLFDEFLEGWATHTGQTFQAFDLVKDYRPYVDGKPRNEGVKSFLYSRNISLPYGNEEDGPDQETICGLGNRKNAFFLETLKDHGVDPYLATVELIRALRAQGKKTAIVTASKNCVEVLESANLTLLFDVKVDGWDADQYHLRGKPAPDVFLKAAELLGVFPQRGVIFEDALAGVHAGHDGNFGTVIGIDRADQTAALYREGADIVVGDLVDIALSQGDTIFSRSSRALPPAFGMIEGLTVALKKKHLAIFLDYDGTLTPIVDRPELAVLSDEMRDTLRILADTWTIGIISGRDRKVVEQLVNINSLYYAGSHGFDIAGPAGVKIQHQVGKECLLPLDRAETKLRSSLATIKGVVIEHKKYSVAVHYRLVAPLDFEKVKRTVSQVLSSEPDLRKTEGKKVYELQPRVEWNKGKALIWLLQALNLSTNDSFPLYLGDDLTDENAFASLHEVGMGIIVDDTFRFTRASYRLKDPQEVLVFLKQLLHVAQEASL
ncbi:MAG: hypothetical protein NPIRA02_26300 [Nitrospirales bacterium]|nr:MAG: hypothetical protein NPIRA02_26300 [Nitrospirales bacterium]